MKTERSFLENALIVAHENSSIRTAIIEQYFEERDIEEEMPLEDCFELLSDKQIDELFRKTFN